MQINHDYDIHIYNIRSCTAGVVNIMVPLLVDIESDAPTPANLKGLQMDSLDQSAIIMPNRLIRDWPPQTVAELQRSHIQQLADLNPELVIIGTGARLEWPDRSLLTPLMESVIGYEIMDTAAACRTYNVLSYEGRRVAVALMMI